MFGILNSTINTQSSNMNSGGEVGDYNTLDDTVLSAIFRAPLTIVSTRLRTSARTLNLRTLATVSQAQIWEIQTGLYTAEGAADMLIHSVVNDVDKTFFVRPPCSIKTYNQALGLKRSGVSSSVKFGTPNNPSGTLGNGTNNPEYGTGLAISRGHGSVQTTTGIGLGESSTFSPIKITLDGDSELYKGDFLTFKGDPKAYLVTDVQGTDQGSNIIFIYIFPALKASLSITQVANFGASATMKCKYDGSSVIGISYIDGILADPGTVTIVEAI